MPISDETETAWPHIPKTGGTSIGNALKVRTPAAAGNTLTYWGMAGEITCSSPFLQHITAAELARLEPERWGRYFTFALIRDPFSRAVSSWKYMTRLARFSGLSLLEYLQRGPGYFLRPMVDFVTDDSGNVMVEEIWRLEEIRRFWRHFCDMKGLSIELPHDNRTGPERYSEIIDRETRSFIEMKYSPDFKMWGFKWED